MGVITSLMLAVALDSSVVSRCTKAVSAEAGSPRGLLRRG